MKKLFALFMTLILAFSLCACKGDEGKTDSESKEVINKMSVGETVSTDLADFTLENSEFTYYVSNVSSNYVEPMDEPNALYNASIGHCYVSLTFTIANKDRGGSISFAGSFSDWDPSFKVTYKGEEYTVKGYDINNNDGRSYLDLGVAAILDTETGKLIKRHGSSNYLLSAGDTVTLRTFGIIDIEPENLTDGFDLTVYVLNSSGKHEEFVYSIPGKQ